MHCYCTFCRYRDALEAVTGEEVAAAAARHLHVAQQLAVVVTSPAEVEATARELQAAGYEVQELRL